VSRTTIGKPLVALVAIAAVALVLVASAQAANGRIGFGFNADSIKGSSGEVFLTGGGAFDPDSGFVHSGGGFRCLTAVTQGKLAGCETGQGVRWDTAELLPNTGLTCTGADAEPAVSTDHDTVVLQADFYRAGDGNDESFTAKMIVSADDIAPNVQGTQNAWIQGVGCGTANVNFSG
jgi:hypothetical protein